MAVGAQSLDDCHAVNAPCVTGRGRVAYPRLEHLGSSHWTNTHPIGEASPDSGAGSSMESSPFRKGRSVIGLAGIRVMKGVAIAVLLLAGACDWIAAPCESNALFGVQVTLTDSVTLGPVLADTVWARATDAAYVDSVRFSNSDRPDPVTSLGFALERAGTYDVQIGATGYQPWRRTGVRVRDGRCHVQPASLTAKLQRSR